MSESDLDVYLNILFDGMTGYIYAPLRAPSKKFSTYFFEWPKKRAELVHHITTHSSSHDVYLGPSIYNRPTKPNKANVKGSQVVWAEFDGVVPNWSELGAPALIVQSSSVDHLHCYWRLDSFQGPVTIEDVNRRITFNFEADSSGWDATQVLRPPGTINHKKGKGTTVTLVTSRPGESLPVGFFDSLPPIEIPSTPQVLPKLDTVISDVHFTQSALELLVNYPMDDDVDRSRYLMHLGHELAEAGLTYPQIIAVLDLADSKVKKFFERPDRYQRLADIAFKAMSKLKIIIVDDSLEDYRDFAFTSLTLKSAVYEFNLIWEPSIMSEALVILSGDPGVGKTTWALYQALKNSKNNRVLFVSLEMSPPQLQMFQNALLTYLEKEEVTVNLENVTYFAPGYDVPRHIIEAFIEEYLPDGVIIDSLSSILHKISDDEAAADAMSWLRRMTANRFVIAIHHNRKLPHGSSSAYTIDDLMGSRFIGAKSDVILNMKRTHGGNTEIFPIKNRFGATNVSIPISSASELLSGTSSSEQPKELTESTEHDAGPGAPLM